MKKTLIFNGSPRVKGNTVSLIEQITKKLDGECKVVNVFRWSIAPCIDCRYCYDHEGCAFNDGMQEVYDYIQECDNIIIASPIYFHMMTGKLLDVASRLETYYCARQFRNIEPVVKQKKGAVLFTCGGDTNVDNAYETACVILSHMNCRDVLPVVCSKFTDSRPATEDKAVLEGISGIVSFLNAD